MSDHLSQEEKAILLRLARQAITAAVLQQVLPALELEALSEHLRFNGVTFVTLFKAGTLRGCVGAMEAYQPLALDVCEHAIAAALHDYRFPPVQAEELGALRIEISRLTPPLKLDYENDQDLLAKLRPGVDGVLIKDGYRRATFLPQVWEKLPDPAEFLDHLCLKMGAPESTWRYRKLDVYLYEVEEFQEA